MSVSFKDYGSNEKVFKTHLIGGEHTSQHAMFDPQIGKMNRISPIGGILAEQTKRLVGPNFGSSIDTNFWTFTQNGTGATGDVASGKATLSSGATDTATYSVFTTVKKARFLFANPNMYRGAVLLSDTTEANNTRYFGAFNHSSGVPSEGFYFKVDASGVLHVCTKTSGQSEVSVASGAFTGDVASFTLDTNIHAYEIVYFVMGAWFFVDGVLLHKIAPTSAVLASELSLPCAASVVKSSGTESADLVVWANSILRLGDSKPAPHFKNISTNATFVLKNGAGTLHRIICNKTANPAPTIVVYDNTAASGTIIASVTETTGGIGTLEYGIDFSLGLTVVTDNAGDWTLCYD